MAESGGTISFTSGLEEMDMQTIEERVLGLGDYLLITLNTERGDNKPHQGLSSPEVWVFRVSRVFKKFSKRYSELPTVGAGESLDFDYLGNEGHGEGDDILRVEDDDFHIMHFGFAPESLELKIWWKLSTMLKGGTSVDREDPSGYSDVGTDFDYIDGTMIKDIRNPPKITEMVSFRGNTQKGQDEGQTVQFAFENVADVDIDPLLWLRGASYKVVPVEDEDDRKHIIRESLKVEKDREIDLTNVKIGGIYSYRTGKIIPEGWQEAGNFELLDGDLLTTEDEGTIEGGN